VTTAVTGLIASHGVLAVLLLSLNLKSAWHWTVKAAAIVLTSGFFVVAFLALQALLGWPTAAPPPARFQLHAALVVEPDRERPDGVIYLWLSPQTDEGEVAGLPRAHALPYSRALHEQTERARERIQEGMPIEGTAKLGDQPGHDSMQVELFEGPRPVLPPKTG
jgi:hypothetical protein